MAGIAMANRKPTEGRRVRRGVAGGGRPAASRPTAVRLTRRGRLVLLASILVFFGLFAVVAAAPGRAADPGGERVSAVVQEGDTLWSFAGRNAPSDNPFATIDEIRRLNGLDGYVIHPGQRLILPRRR